MESNNNRFKKRLITALMIVSIAVIAFWSYHDILDYFFTATDSLTLIDTSRIRSGSDAIRIFTEPLMNGTQFTEGYKYYRPITTLSFSLDYFIWGINPFGYHLTDLLLHVAVSLLVFFMIRSLTGNQKVTAWLGALLFSLHPVLMESVPANARRQDILAAAFLLLSLISFLSYHRAVLSRKGMLFWSLFLYALALGSKELVAILPFMLFTYLIVCDISTETASASKRIAKSVKSVLPYLVITVLFFIWRTYVLGGLGGITTDSSFNPWFYKQPLYKIVSVYAALLISPQSLASKTTSVFVTGPISALALLMLGERIVHLRNQFVIRSQARSSYLWRVIVDIILFAIILGCLMKILIGGLENGSMYHIVLYCAVWMSLIVGVGSIGRVLRDEQHGRLIAVWLVWLSFPLLIYIVVKQMPLRGMYFPVIPFSGIVAVVLTGSIRSIAQKAKEDRNKQGSQPASSKRSLVIGIILFIAVLSLSVHLVVFSPLFVENSDWEASGAVASIFLKKLSETVPQLPQKATVEILGLPWIATSRVEQSGAQSVTQLHQRSVQSWLDIKHPGNQLTIRIRRYSNYLDTVPRDFDLQAWVSESGEEAKIRVKAID